MAKLQVQTKKVRFPVAPTLYGLFFEDINRSGDGGLYPEMLRNRSFDDSVIPADLKEKDGWLYNDNGYPFAYYNGEGFQRWIRDNNNGELTPIPAWYAEGAQMRLETEHTLNAKREAALEVAFEPDGRVWNIGYAGVPAQAGEAYHLYLFAQVEQTTPLELSIEAEGQCLCSCRLTLTGAGFVRYDMVLVPSATSGKGRFVIKAPKGGKVLFGFMSLMPMNTYRGHGLRLDLAEKLEAMHPAFLRFPGGCIVEGMSLSTAMRFSETVGPVWERKGHINVWEYRMTDGLGYHEYLQLCEDLGAEALYVCNCGMTCQGRRCVLMENEELDKMLQEALDALEYALGPVDSKWGALRARMGHPAPFRLNYLEIGNENMGEEYEHRYELFRSTILARYPHLKIVANTHVERSGLKLDIADEHFYDRTEWFARNSHYYDAYDRNGPEIFVGEFAVTSGPIHTLYPAVGEAMFMIGMERNQDIVTLAAYAPLFENIHYALWNPNLIVFDNLRSYGLPSYSVWRLFGGSRGKEVVQSQQESGIIYVPYVKGGPALLSAGGTAYRNASWNGAPVAATRELLGHVKAEGDGFVVAAPNEDELDPMMRRFGFGDRTMVVLGDDDSSRQGVFEVEALACEGKEISIGVCCCPLPQGYMGNDEKREDPWSMHNLRPVTWTIKDGKSVVTEGSGMRPVVLSKEIAIDFDASVYHKMKMVNTGTAVECWLDGALLHTAELPHYEAIQTVALNDGEDLILKIAHIGDQPEQVEIQLDCEVESAYTVGLLTGAPDDCNSLEEPEKVADHTVTCTGAAKTFVYEAPAYSVSVLRLHKSQTQ